MPCPARQKYTFCPTSMFGIARGPETAAKCKASSHSATKNAWPQELRNSAFLRMSMSPIWHKLMSGEVPIATAKNPGGLAAGTPAHAALGYVRS